MVIETGEEALSCLLLADPVEGPLGILAAPIIIELEQESALSCRVCYSPSHQIIPRSFKEISAIAIAERSRQGLTEEPIGLVALPQKFAQGALGAVASLGYLFRNLDTP